MIKDMGLVRKQVTTHEVRNSSWKLLLAHEREEGGWGLRGACRAHRAGCFPVWDVQAGGLKQWLSNLTSPDLTSVEPVMQQPDRELRVGSRQTGGMDRQHLGSWDHSVVGSSPSSRLTGPQPEPCVWGLLSGRGGTWLLPSVAWREVLEPSSPLRSIAKGQEATNASGSKGNSCKLRGEGFSPWVWSPQEREPPEAVQSPSSETKSQQGATPCNLLYPWGWPCLGMALD